MTMAVGLAAGIGAVGISGPAGATTPSGSVRLTDAVKTLHFAYLPFAVANSYEAPMLAAARAAAKAGGATLTVLAANDSPQTQYAQMQTALSSGQYQGIVVQPILSTGLTPLVRQAVAKGLKVVTVDQILGPKLTTAAPQVAGISASVVFVPTTIGTKLGHLVVRACASKRLNPCDVGYLYDLKASSLDVALHASFARAVAGSPVRVVGVGQDYYTPSMGLTATQDLLQAHPSINLIVGSDQGIEGGAQAVASAGKTGKVLLVGYGGSAAGISGVKSGAWYGTVAQLPGSEGRLAVQDLIKAVRSGTAAGGVDPTLSLPNGGVITKANASAFRGQWPG